MLRLTLMMLLVLALSSVDIKAAEIVVPAGVPTAPAEPVVYAPPSSPLPPDAFAVTTPGYKVAVDDILQLTVWGEQAMQGIYLAVTPEGTLNAPVVGTIQAVGRTVDEIKSEIARRFIQLDYLKDPIIQITLYQIHKMKVRVLGQVQRPGLQLMRDGDKADQAVAEAGGFLPDTADLANASISRPGVPDPIKVDLKAVYFGGDLSKLPELKDGDTIYIPEDTSGKFYVLGYVLQPRSFPLKPTSTVMDAITLAGGASQRASLSRTVIIRKSVDGKPSQRVPVNVTKILKTGDTTLDVKLQPGDVVYVPETNSLDWNKISQVLSFVTNLNYLKRFGTF